MTLLSCNSTEEASRYRRIEIQFCGCRGIGHMKRNFLVELGYCSPSRVGDILKEGKRIYFKKNLLLSISSMKSCSERGFGSI